MPYIEAHRRGPLDAGDKPRTPGELHYVLTTLVAEYLGPHARYSGLNEAIGVLECVKQELYRRILAPYEDRKRVENGEVYGAILHAPITKTGE